MRRALFGLALLAGCASPTHPPGPGPEGRFRLAALEGVESTSPESFPPEDWAEGLRSKEKPTFLEIAGGTVTMGGSLAASGAPRGAASGNELSASHTTEEGGIRLDISFRGSYDPARDEIQGTLEQIWEITEEGGSVRLSARARFSREPR